MPGGALGSGKWFPEKGFARWSWIVLFALLIAIKFLAIFHFRADSDETQHAHVVWALTQGQMPYRDFFDNHMPLFQMLCAPLFHLLGEHPYILIELRFAMFPLYLLCLWCVWVLAGELFSRQLAPWICLFAGALPRFFYTSTEFRTDDLWAVLWLSALTVALTGKFTVKRALAFGILIGLAFAVSLKTVILAATIFIATAMAVAIGLCCGGAVSWRDMPLHALLIALGVALFPAAIAYYFHAHGAFWIMDYCVLQHNILPGLQTWGGFLFGPWIFPCVFPVLVGLGIFAYKQGRDHSDAVRRAIIVLVPCVYAALLFSYWREITREDDLTYVPLIPLAATPFLLYLKKYSANVQPARKLQSLGYPLLCAAAIAWTWKTNDLRANRMQNTSRGIKDVILISRPGDFVMDNKGGYIFRPRPIYWVFEPVTKERIRRGLIKENVPASLAKTGTKLCYLYTRHEDETASEFIMSNYMAFDPEALDLGAAGKEMTPADTGGMFYVDVKIRAIYQIVSEKGTTEGTLDGGPYVEPVQLAPGRHWFRRISGLGRSAIFLADAISAGFHPLFDASAALLKGERARDLEGQRKIGVAQRSGIMEDNLNALAEK